MILLLSGEGPTDIGVCLKPTGECEGESFRPGPMAWFVAKLVAPIWGYSPLDSVSCVFVSEESLCEHSRRRVGMTLPGKKKVLETGYFFKQARGLAILAGNRAKLERCSVGAILFRDSDGTNASRRSLWADKVKSMEDGFSAENFDFGVPMVPKPKSEVWLLCALQEVEYQNCARLENFSGNDNSPESAKAALHEILTARRMAYADVSDMIEKGSIDPHQIDMPSFNHFRDRLEQVAQQMLR